MMEKKSTTKKPTTSSKKNVAAKQQTHKKSPASTKGKYNSNVGTIWDWDDIKNDLI